MMPPNKLRATSCVQWMPRLRFFPGSRILGAAPLTQSVRRFLAHLLPEPIADKTIE